MSPGLTPSDSPRCSLSPTESAHFLVVRTCSGWRSSNFKASYSSAVSMLPPLHCQYAAATVLSACCKGRREGLPSITITSCSLSRQPQTITELCPGADDGGDDATAFGAGAEGEATHLGCQWQLLAKGEAVMPWRHRSRGIGCFAAERLATS